MTRLFRASFERLPAGERCHDARAAVRAKGSVWLLVASRVLSESARIVASLLLVAMPGAPSSVALCS